MTQSGRLQSVTKQYRAHLLAGEAQATQTLERAYTDTLARVMPALNQLYAQIEEKQKNGESIPLSWLYERNRLESLKKLLQGEINHFGALAQMQTGQLQHQGVQLGLQLAQAQLQATVPVGIKYSFGVPHPAAIANLVGATQAGSASGDLFNGFGEEAAQSASKALIAGVSLGQNPRQIAGQVQQALNVPRYRALTISRTEMLRAYRSAALETYKANSDVCDGWTWQATLDRRTCLACIAMNGTRHSLEEEMGTHPNCRCAMSPLTKSWSDILGPAGATIPDTSLHNMQSGSDWLDNQDEATQREVLGNKYEGWANGDFTLSDIVGHSHDPDWGHSIYEKSLKQLVGR